MLWEHLVLNELCGRLQTKDVQYWRDKRGHEIDFVLARRNNPPAAIECKWSAEDFTPTNLLAFRRIYPEGENYVVANDVSEPFSRAYGNTSVRFVRLEALVEAAQGLV